MGSEQLVQVLRGIPQSDIVYEVIVDSLIESLYTGKKLNGNTYTKIKDEVDVLRRSMKKVKDKKFVNHKNSVEAAVPPSQPSATPKMVESKDVYDKLGQKPSRNPTQKRVSDLRQGQGRLKGKPHAQITVSSNDKSSGHGHNVSRAQNDPYDRHNEERSEEYLQELEELKEVNRRLERDVEKLKEVLQNAREDASNLRLRLSKIAGDQLKTNNPNITDLSDEYRPTNLGRHFAELYDNEWSDAYEEVQRDFQNEMRSIELLHNIVKHAFRSCERKAKLQEEKITEILFDTVQEGNNSATADHPTRIDNLHNLLIDTRKKILPYSSVNVSRNYMSKEFCQISDPADIKRPGSRLKAFASKCAKLCWCMNVCDPPMGMSLGQTGQPYDKNSFREYTRSVKNLKKPEVDFFVWPALYLHVGGHLVSKGVAQPREGDVRRK